MDLYCADSITVLSGLEPVRKRPGMYFGGVDATALHHMLWEIVGNAVDAHLRGEASYVRVQIDGDQICVEDDGAGIPVDRVPSEPEKTVLEVVMTCLHAGSVYTADHVHLRGGLWGVGCAAVNALSERLDAEVWRDGRHHMQSYERGVALGPVRDLGPAERTGTRITLRPDFSIFEPCRWNRAVIARRLREIAAASPSLTAILDHTAVRCPDGLVDLARFMARRAPAIAAPVRITGVRDDIAVEVALLWTTESRVRRRGFVGMSPARRGTHLHGLADGLLGAFVALDGARFSGVHPAAFAEVIERGLVAVVNVMLRDPRYGNPTREHLVSPEVRSAVAGLVSEELHRRLVEDPALREALLGRMPPTAR